MTRHGTISDDCAHVIYIVHGYYLYGGIEFTGLTAFTGNYVDAESLARYVVAHSFERSEVILAMSDGLRINECCYQISADEYCRDDTLESLRILREAGVLMPDPEDSEFFATSCKPLEM